MEAESAEIETFQSQKHGRKGNRSILWYVNLQDEPVLLNHLTYCCSAYLVNQDRAMRFIRAVRQLGVTEDGVSFLDQFRSLITEVFANFLHFLTLSRIFII